jgi:uncharacterized protein YegP (UPF0339 family)
MKATKHVIEWQNSPSDAWWYGYWMNFMGGRVEVMREEEGRWIFFFKINGKVTGDSEVYKNPTLAKNAAIEYVRSGEYLNHKYK